MKKPRGLFIAGNWKMNHGPSATSQFLDKVAHDSKLKTPGLTTLLFIPNISLATASEKIKNSLLLIGAQNAHWEKSGAFTGETSGPMLSEIKVHHVLTGHSERRQFFGETDETVGLRTLSLLEQGFQVMLCIGETLEERQSKKTGLVLERQLEKGLPKGIERFLDGKLSLAYEPVWAIGTGMTASVQQAEEAHQLIRKWLWDRFGMEASGRTPILYGGSVKPENCVDLMSCPNIDGALVGGASLKSESFLALVEGASKVLKS